jgi:hypothetical protein
LIVNPLGSPVALKVYGVAPPAACTVALYEAPTVAAGNDVVVMLSVPAWPATIVRLNVAVAVCAVPLVESVTETPTLAVPVAVGVPEIVPVTALMERPPGNPVALKVKGERPPVTEISA